jgi:hypothetical protein
VQSAVEMCSIHVETGYEKFWYDVIDVNKLTFEEIHPCQVPGSYDILQWEWTGAPVAISLDDHGALYIKTPIGKFCVTGMRSPEYGLTRRGPFYIISGCHNTIVVHGSSAAFIDAGSHRVYLENGSGTSCDAEMANIVTVRVSHMACIHTPPCAHGWHVQNVKNNSHGMRLISHMIFSMIFQARH